MHFSAKRGIAIACRLSVRPSVAVKLCRRRLYEKYCGAKVTIDSLKEVVYKKSIGTKMNDLDLCLKVVLRSSHQPLRHIRH